MNALKWLGAAGMLALAFSEDIPTWLRWTFGAGALLTLGQELDAAMGPKVVAMSPEAAAGNEPAQTVWANPTPIYIS